MTTTVKDTDTPVESDVVAAHLRAFRFALNPTPEQANLLARHTGNARKGFNFALGRKRDAHQQWRDAVARLVNAGISEADARRQVKIKIPTRFDNQAEFNRTKGDDRIGVDGIAPWWHEVSTYAFQSAMTDADRAWSNWLSSLSGNRAGRRVGYPQFKKKGRSRDSVRIHHDVNHPSIRPDGYRHLRVPRLGSIRTHQSGKRLARYLTRAGGHIQSVTLSRAGTRWYAAVLVTAPAPAPARLSRAQRAAGTVGVDLGVSRLATLSTGLDHSYANPRHLAKARKRLTRAQRTLSRTVKGSKRRLKAIIRVSRLHHQIAERRSGTVHQLTAHLTRTYATVAIEDLNVVGMTASARGTLDKPGRGVRQKAGLNRSVLDAGFGEFRRQLTYKTAWTGTRLHVIDRFYPSSKTCSTCGTVKPNLSLGERTYRCDSCGTAIDRDLNAALNIAAAADAPLAPRPVAADTSETLNARRGRIRLARKGKRRPAKREDTAPAVPPPRSDPGVLPPAAQAQVNEAWRPRAQGVVPVDVPVSD